MTQENRGIGGQGAMKNGLFLRRLLAGVTVLSLAVVLWGCGQAAPTEVGFEQTLQPAGDDPPPPSDGDPTGWW